LRPARRDQQKFAEAQRLRAKVVRVQKRRKCSEYRVCTWNFQTGHKNGARGPRRLAVVHAHLDAIGADVALGQEHRRPETQGHYRDAASGFDIFISGGGPRKGQDGVSCSLKTDIVLSSEIRVNYFSERLIHVRVKSLAPGASNVMNFISFYAPTEGEDEDVKDLHWHALHKMVSELPKGESLMIGTDANARTDHHVEEGMEKVLGRHGRDELNDNGRRLLEFAFANDMAIASTFFRKPRRETHTFQFAAKKGASGVTARLDYILTRQAELGHISDITVHDRGRDASDHFIVRACVRGRVSREHRPEKKAAKKTFNRSALRDGATRGRVARAVAESMKDLTFDDDTVDINVLEKRWSAEITRAAMESAGPPPKKNKREGDWFNSEEFQAIIRPLAAEQLAKHRAWKASGSNASKAESRAATKACKASVVAADNRYWEKKAAKMEGHSTNKEPRQFYETMKGADSEKPHVRATQHIRDEDNVLLCDEEEILARWGRHFEGILNPDPAAPKLDYEAIMRNVVQQDVNESLGAEPTLHEVMAALEAMKNEKACGPDDIPVELLKLYREEPTIMKKFVGIVKCVWRREEAPQSWKDAIIFILFKKLDKTLCGNYRGISLVAHAGKVLLKLVEMRLSRHAETCNILPEEQCGFRRGRSTIDMLFVARMLQEFARDKNVSIFMLFIDLMKAYDCIDRTLLWLILAKIGVPEKMINVIRAFHDGMQAVVRLEGGALSKPFDVSGGLRQGCVLAPVMFNIFFAVVLQVAVSRFDADVIKDHIDIKCRMDDSDPLDSSTRTKALKTFISKLWSMLYADDAGIASRTQESLSKMMEVIVTTCAEFGLTVSEKKTESMYIATRSGETVKMTIKAAGQEYKQVDRFPYLGGIFSEAGGISAELSRRKQRAFGKMRKYSRVLFDQRHIWLRLKVSILKSEVIETLLYGCMTWAMKIEHYTLLRRAHHHFLLRLIGFRKKARTDRLLSYSRALEMTRCESIETTVRRRRLGWAGKLWRMDDSRLPKIMMCGELDAGKRKVGGSEKQWRQCVRDDLKAFEINAESWWMLATCEQEWTTAIEDGATLFMQKWHTKEKEASHARALARANQQQLNA
jgi:hypothetical protein